MNIFLFLFALFISFVVVRIGAIAFELTGLPWSLAKFQAVSCFTGTGFTTKEAELITTHVQRRRVATVLMILGNAGFVAMIATFANSLRPDSLLNSFTLPGLVGTVPKGMLPWLNLLIIIFGVTVIAKFFNYSGFAYQFRKHIRKYFVKKDIIKQVSFEELTLATGGYGITQIEICKDSPILDKKILETELREHDITILTVEREGKTIPNPPADTVIQMGDSVTCFGRLEHIRRELSMPSK